MVELLLRCVELLGGAVFVKVFPIDCFIKLCAE
jgi:hypothetical protein